MMVDSVRIENEAADWLARFDGLDPGSDDISAYEKADPDFANWLKPVENRVAFLRLYGAWRRADRLAALASGQDVVAVRRQWRLPAWAVAACIALIALAGIWGPVGESPEIYETAIGGHETVPLADGSRVELNTDTRLTARISESARTVVLEKGEAYFEIFHDKTRPFIVEAGNKKITVLGTKFTVWRKGDEVEVIVTEGRVQIQSSTGQGILQPTVIQKGTQALLRRQGVLIAQKSEGELKDALGWRQGVLFFDQMDLANVAGEFNRYNRVKLVIADPQVAKLRIGGSFRAENVDVFVRLLKDGFGLKVEREDHKIIIKK